MQSLAESNLKKQRHSFIAFFLPLFLIGNMGSTITFLRYIFNTNTRWITFFILMLFMVANIQVLKYLGKQLTIILYLYVGWCFLSTFWSDFPLLSFMKSCLLAATVFTTVLAGMEWVKTHAWNEALDYLWILVLITLLAGFLGGYVGDPSKASIKMEEIHRSGEAVFMYQGLVGGSNMFGALLAMSIPYLLWKTYQAWANKKQRLIYIFLMLAAFYFLALSIARASILATVVTLFGFLISLRLNKKLMIFFMVPLVVIGTMFFNPDLIENLALKYIYKTSQKNVFYSREAVWRDSYMAAIEGGWSGLGYGVSFGQNEFDFKNTFTSVGYGREKGNSQLGIVEETGLVGVGLYLLLISILFYKLVRLYFKVKDPDQRVLIGIVTGIFLGMIGHSMFEAWWDSPSIVESVYFWLLVGVIRGLEITLGNKRIRYAASEVKA